MSRLVRVYCSYWNKAVVRVYCSYWYKAVVIPGSLSTGTRL